MNKILVVDDENDIRKFLSELLLSVGFSVKQAESGDIALKMIEQEPPDLVLLDQVLPGKLDGIQLLKKIKTIDATIMVIILTGYGEVKTAVDAMKIGAYDYLTKPFENDELILSVKRALESRSLSLEVKNLKQKLAYRDTLESLMGSSLSIKRIHSQIEKVASTDFTVFIQGESGTGKEIVAQAIHSLSLRRNGAFVAVDCGAIPDTLVESELFGYERGAFTGADARKEGQFELANQGTIFLDEISNLPFQVQKKLLRLIQEKKVQHLGGKKLLSVDVRIIAATNENVVKLIEQGHFRNDLYYRLAEFVILMPPLRERENDILFLSKRFLKETNNELNKSIKGFTEEAEKVLMTYTWKGNVRELKNVVRRAVLLAEKIIGTEHLIFDTPGIRNLERDYCRISFDESCSLKKLTKRVVGSVERQAIKKVLIKTGGNKNKAARLLEVDYKTLHTKIKNYGINVQKIIQETRQ